MSFGTRWNGVFCFLDCFSGFDSCGDVERLRFLSARPESDEEVKVEERLVSAVETFWAGVAWRVTLESLDVGVTFSAGLEDGVDIVFVGLGGFEKSISSESLLDEVVPEDEELTLAAAAAGTPSGASDSLSDEEVSEDEDVSSFPADAFFSAGIDFGALRAEPLSADEESEDEEVSPPFAVAFTLIFLAGAGLSVFMEDFASAFRFSDLVLSLVAEAVGSLAPLESFSSSASLSELELDVEGDDNFAFTTFFAFF